VRPDLREIARSRPELLAVYVSQADAAEAAAMIADWRKTDPDLTSLGSHNLAMVLAAWFSDDPAGAEPLIRASPRWLEAAWPSLAQAHAAKKEFEQACALARRFTPPPASPPLPPGTRDSLQRRLTFDPTDFGAALAFSRLEEQAGDVAMARFVVGKACEQADAPPVLFYRQAELAERARDWESAWRAWQRYHDKRARTPR
jgi:hypothetical protein